MRAAPLNAVRTPITEDKIKIAAGLKPRVRMNGDGTIEILGVNSSNYFGPMDPMIPLAQNPALGAVGRQYDYQTGANLQYIPRGDTGIGFDSLRALAENYDLLRLVIETRKDQMAALDWKISAKDRKLKQQPSTKDVEDFLAYPDKVNSFGDWMRTIIEERLVTDAATIYPRMTNGGDLFALEYLDGATIFPLIDATGRTPLPPSPAYQQIIKGVPSVDYAMPIMADLPLPAGAAKLPELIYRPANKRVWRRYGLPPVEQIIVTVNIALRRQAFQLDYYREGSIPDAFMGLPETWAPAQIAEFQNYWDQMFSNPTGENAGMRRKVRMVPKGEVTFSKEAILKDEMDEWLARICCYAFSVEPTPFIKQMNRATAQAQREQSLSEGLVPLKKWFKAMMDFLIAKYLKRPDLEFAWDEEESVDTKTASDIAVAEVDAGIITPDEVREGRGLEPLPQPAAGDQPHLPTNETIQGATGAADPAGGATGATGTVEAKPTPVPVKKRAPAVPMRRQQMIEAQRLGRFVKRFFRGQAAKAKTILAAKLDKSDSHADATKLAKADLFTADEWRSLWEEFPDVVFDPLNKASADAVAGAAEKTAGVAIQPGWTSDYAADYARDRGAEMVGMKYVDGELVINPDAEWAIDEGTRASLAKLLEQAIEDGWTVDKLSAEIDGEYAFSADRAATIAATEIRMANSEGSVAAWKQSGVVARKVWLTAEDDLVSEDCAENGDAGEIDIDDDFPSGDNAPPCHPNCRCVIAPVVDLGDTEDTGDTDDTGE